MYCSGIEGAPQLVLSASAWPFSVAEAERRWHLGKPGWGVSQGESSLRAPQSTNLV